MKNDTTPINKDKDMDNNQANKTLTIKKSTDISLFERVEHKLDEMYELRYNEVTNEVEYRKRNQDQLPDFERLNENNIYTDLQKNGYKISMANLMTIFGSDFVKEYNPFAEYFLCLPKHDGKDHIKTLAAYVDAKEPDRFEQQLKKHLVRAVACALEPKYFNKHAFVLVGFKQNTGKTSFCRFLCPPKLEDYYTEIFTTDKDGLIALSENFIINLDELATLDRSETNKLKATFSKDSVKVRHPFGKKAVRTPRRASFFGSTNDQEFLADETGSVRWLCFEIDKIDWVYSQRLKPDDIWTQAYHLYKKGYKYQLTKEDIEKNEKANRKFQKTTYEQELIQKYYAPGNDRDNDEFFTATDVYTDLQTRGVSTNKISHLRIGKALNSLGFTRTTKRQNTHPQYGYYIKYIKNALTTPTTYYK